MNIAYCLGLSLLYGLLGAGPAHAHPGGHAGLAWSRLVAHLGEPDHLAALALPVAVGAAVAYAGRRLRRQRARDKR